MDFTNRDNLKGEKEVINRVFWRCAGVDNTNLVTGVLARWIIPMSTVKWS